MGAVLDMAVIRAKRSLERSEGRMRIVVNRLDRVDMLHKINSDLERNVRAQKAFNAIILGKRNNRHEG